MTLIINHTCMSMFVTFLPLSFAIVISQPSTISVSRPTYLKLQNATTASATWKNALNWLSRFVLSPSFLIHPIYHYITPFHTHTLHCTSPNIVYWPYLTVHTYVCPRLVARIPTTRRYTSPDFIRWSGLLDTKDLYDSSRRNKYLVSNI